MLDGFFFGGVTKKVREHYLAEHVKLKIAYNHNNMLLLWKGNKMRFLKFCFQKFLNYVLSLNITCI